MNSAPARAPTILRRFSVNAFEPVTWSVRRPERGQLGDEVDRDDRLPGAGPARDDERDLLLVLAGAADRIHDRVVGDLLFVEEREDRLVADDAGDVVEQALVRPEGGVGDSLEDRRRRPGRRRGRRGRSRARPTWSPANDGFVAEERREVGVVERRLRVVLRVVQVGAGVERDRRLVGERRVRVEQVALVLRDLARRVERRRAAGRRSRRSRSR